MGNREVSAGVSSVVRKVDVAVREGVIRAGIGVDDVGSPQSPAGPTPRPCSRRWTLRLERWGSGACGSPHSRLSRARIPRKMRLSYPGCRRNWAGNARWKRKSSVNMILMMACGHLNKLLETSATGFWPNSLIQWAQRRWRWAIPQTTRRKRCCSILRAAAVCTEPGG